MTQGHTKLKQDPYLWDQSLLDQQRLLFFEAVNEESLKTFQQQRNMSKFIFLQLLGIRPHKVKTLQ